MKTCFRLRPVCVGARESGGKRGFVGVRDADGGVLCVHPCQTGSAAG